MCSDDIAEVVIDQPFLTFFYLSTLLVTPKHSSTPHHWLTPGYHKDKVKTDIFLLFFTTTYVTFPAHPEIDFSTPG